MGRPINKRFFGANASNNIRVEVNTGTGALQAFILEQKGSKKFLVQTPIGTQHFARLVGTITSSLSAGQMNITVKLDNGEIGQIKKISGRVLTAEDGRRYGWNFSTSTSDTYAQIEEAGTNSSMAGSVNLE